MVNTNNKIRVSYLENTKSKSPIEVEFINFLKEMYSNVQHQNRIKAIRDCKTKDEAGELKRNLCAICPGSILNGGHSAKCIEEKTQLLFLDIDGHSRAEAVSIKEKLIEIIGSFSFAIVFSASGNGIHAYINVEIPNKKIEYWETIRERLSEHSIIIDASTKNVDNRLAFIGYDEDPFFNEVPAAWSEIEIIETPKEIKNDSSGLLSIKGLTERESEKACNKINTWAIKKGLEFEDGRRHEFILHFTTQANTSGVLLGALLKFLGKKYELTSFPDHLKTVMEIYERNKNDFGSNDNWNKEPSKNFSIDDVKKFLNDNFEFRYNTITNDTEFKNYNDKHYKIMVDREFNNIYLMLRSQGSKIGQATLRTIFNSDFIPSYCPFHYYFENLKFYDDKDYINELASTVSTKDQKFFVKVLKKWLVAMVNALLNDDEYNENLLIFVGKQGCGKTRWFNKLIPSALSNYYSSAPTNLADKDAAILMNESMLILLDELESFRRYGMTFMKAMTSKNKMKIRKPYARTPEILINHASYAGAVNDQEFLNDDTGTRRFLCVEVDNADFKHEVDMDKVFAQVYHLLKSGFKYWFDSEEIKEINLNNEKFLYKSPVEEYILRFFEEPKLNDNRYVYSMTSTEILDYLTEHSRASLNQVTAQKIGTAMKKIGIKKVMSKGINRYKVVIKNDPNNTEESNLSFS